MFLPKALIEDSPGCIPGFFYGSNTLTAPGPSGLLLAFGRTRSFIAGGRLLDEFRTVVLGVLAGSGSTFLGGDLWINMESHGIFFWLNILKISALVKGSG